MRVMYLNIGAYRRVDAQHTGDVLPWPLWRIIDWCCLYYTIISSRVALLAALFARIRVMCFLDHRAAIHEQPRHVAIYRMHIESNRRDPKTNKSEVTHTGVDCNSDGWQPRHSTVGHGSHNLGSWNVGTGHDQFSHCDLARRRRHGRLVRTPHTYIYAWIYM